MNRFLTARRHFWTPWFRTKSLYGKRTVVFSLSPHTSFKRGRLARDSYATLYRFFYWFWGEKKTTVLQSSFKTGAWGNSKMACFIPKIHYLLGNKSSPWDMVTYFQTNKTLEINGNLLSREVRKLLFSVLRREQWDNMLLGVAIAIFCTVRYWGSRTWTW